MAEPGLGGVAWGAGAGEARAARFVKLSRARLLPPAAGESCQSAPLPLEALQPAARSST